MKLPDPTDLLSNPVRFWGDVIVMQIGATKQAYEVAASFNPFLPKGLFDDLKVTSPQKPAPRRRPARSAPKPKAAAPVVVAVSAPAKPASNGTAKPTAKAKAPASKKPAQAAAPKTKPATKSQPRTSRSTKTPPRTSSPTTRRAST